MEKVERLRTQLSNLKGELKQSAKVGTNVVLTVSGGVIAGYCYADHPTIPGTTFPTAAALGAGLSLGAVTGIFDDYSDPLAAIGAGLLAVVVSKESEAYFRKP
jgi:hypothetical protein